MKKMYPYLKDQQFLQELISLPVTTYFVTVTLLNWNEHPIEAIQGKITNASINIDGRSSVRRTASITMAIEDLNEYPAYQRISINKKVNIEIGYFNTTDKYLDYDIIWFPLGLYVITSCSSTYNASSGINLSLQLKDKMCLLNGECGGTLNSSVVFDSYETVDQNGEMYIQRPTIYQIIQQLVNHFGNEQLGKIIISDLDSRVKQVMKWTGSNPLYFLSTQVTESGRTTTQYYVTIDENDAIVKEGQGFRNIDGSPFGYGSDIGFIYTDFTYPGDLIGDAGNTVTDILDKIKSVLGNYEYFYDLDGNFIFQQIKNYLNNAQSKYVIDSLNADLMPPDYISTTYSQQETYLMNMSKGKSVFRFDNSDLIMSYANNPQFNMIKNDFVIWGIRKSVDGNNIPLRYHLAIDTKPKTGNTYTAFEYKNPEDGILKWHLPLQFTSINNFPRPGAVGTYYMDTSTNKIYRWGAVNFVYDYIELNVQLENITTTDWRTELYFQGVVAEPYGVESNFYYTELLNEWPQIYDIRNGVFKEQAIKNPSGINYYLDFLDTEGMISQFKVENIGRRTLVINEAENVNCVFEPYIPDIVLINLDLGSEMQQLIDECQARNQQYYQIPGVIYNSLSTGGSFNSGYDYIRQLLHQHTSFNQNINLQTLPIYFLEPNTRITVNNVESNIYGDYMIENLSFALDTSSILTISAKRALEKI